MQDAWKQKLRHAIDCDLRSFFDTVNHDRLLNQLRLKNGSGNASPRQRHSKSEAKSQRLRNEVKLLRLIGRYLRAGVVLPDGTREATPLGVPQGGPLSPLLANISLDPLDKEIERRGHVHARYADDFIILVDGKMKAQRVMESVTRFIERKLKLVVNGTKSKSGPLIESSFLGFCISSRGSIKWTAKAYARLKQRIKDITRRNRGHTVQNVIDELRRYATGWMNYFGISRTYREVLELDEWIRRRVRLYHWKQWKRPRARRRNLIKLGADPSEVHMATRSRKGLP
ncbi:MAG: hypothetical protein KDK99_08805 [Verrucomicrobiales bacterium]|nr:hypothetical protein [Verrucomicrobiales bacterium]